jgi:polar amino acid transport system substrate-binding protein
MKFFFTFFILVLTASAEAATPLKFGVSTSNSPPLLYQFENQNMPIATGGFIYEISVAIAEELREPYSIVTIPRGRIPQEITSGGIDVLCHSSIRWNLPYKEEVEWSKPLYTYGNVLVGRAPVLFKKPSQVQNTTVGTVSNFYYADLEESFRNKKLFRDDAPSVGASISKLLGERVDYIVMSEIEYNYHKKIYPTLHRSSFVEDKTEIQCTLSKKSTLSLAKLNKAIEHLTENKTLQKIHDRYAKTKNMPRPLNYGLNNNNSPPFIFFDDKSSDHPTVQGGVFFDIALAIGKQIKRPINFILLPRGRLDADLAEGKVDLVCFDTEIWAGKHASSYYWSLPIFQQTNYIVGLKSLKEGADPKTLKDLKGQIIGTTLNFVYPTLEPYFKDGTLHREDADSGTANIARLNFQRVPYIVMNNLEYGYFKKVHPRLQKLPIAIDPIDVKCAISKKSDLKLSVINTAIKEMSKSGKLQKVFEF